MNDTLGSIQRFGVSVCHQVEAHSSNVSRVFISQESFPCWYLMNECNSPVQGLQVKTLNTADVFPQEHILCTAHTATIWRNTAGGTMVELEPILSITDSRESLLSFKIQFLVFMASVPSNHLPAMFHIAWNLATWKFGTGMKTSLPSVQRWCQVT